VTAQIKAGYEHSRRVIADLESRLATLREEAIEEIREDVGKLTAILDRLGERAGNELQELKMAANFKMAELEAGLWLSIEDAKAHLKIIQAKRDLVLARVAILRNDLVEAERRVESAAKNIDEARSLALGHHESLDALQRQIQQMLAAVRARADTMKTSIDALIKRSERLLDELGDVSAAARTAA
jgi:Mg2+ and Co2+ transporter CorA